MGDIWGNNTGAELLDEVEAFVRRFVAYPSEHAAVVHALWIAHTHVMESWENTPRLAFLSPEPGSGKSRALEVTELLVPRPVHAVNVSPAYLFRKVSDEAGTPTILYDEIDTVFGPKAKDNEDIRGMLNAGHRRGATAGRCVVRGKVVETEELPAYCAVGIAGLNDVPDTIGTRSIIVRMRRRAPGERVEAFRHRLYEAEGHELRDRLADWLTPQSDTLRDAWPALPPEVFDREADCWEPLLAVADVADRDWPDRARAAAVAFVADRKANVRESLGVRLLTDLYGIFHPADKEPNEHLATETILEALNALEESPWGDLRGKPLDARGLSRRLGNYGIKPRNVRIGATIPKGYTRTDLFDAWCRYVPNAEPDLSATSATSGQMPPESPNSSTVTESSLVDEMGGCAAAGYAPGVELSDEECADCGKRISVDRASFGKTKCSNCEELRNQK